MMVWTEDKVFVTSDVSITVFNLLSETSSALPNEITMVDPSSFDDLFEQPTSENQPNATQNLDSGSSDTFDYGSSSDSSHFSHPLPTDY